MTTVIEITGNELRQLRYRLGWSLAEMARNLNLELSALSDLENGAQAIPPQLKSSLMRIMFQAENNAAQVARRPIAEVIMKERGLSQVHDFDCQFDVVAPPAWKPSGRA